MKKKTNKDQQENYLERKPKRHEAIAWAKDEKGIVTLDIENTGFFNRLAQKFFHKPKVTHIHLDEMGSFVWPIMDGKTSSPLAKKWRSSSERKPIHCTKDWQNSFRYLTVIILLPGIRNMCACIKLNTFVGTLELLWGLY